MLQHGTTAPHIEKRVLRSRFKDELSDRWGGAGRNERVQGDLGSQLCIGAQRELPLVHKV